MQVFEARFGDPEEMPERMSGMVRNFSIAPMCRGPFEASVKGARLGSVALFRLSTTAARVISHNALGHLGIDLPGSSSASFLPRHYAGSWRRLLGILENPVTD